MEIDISGLSQDQLQTLARRCCERIAQEAGNLAPDTREPLLFGADNWDARRIDGLIQFAIHNRLGWTILLMSDADCCAVIESLARCARESLQAKLAQSELVAGAIVQ